MVNKSKCASALVLLLSLSCRYATAVEIPGRLNAQNFPYLPNGRRATFTDETAPLNGGPNGPHSLDGKPERLASLDIIRNADVEIEKKCSLSDEVLAKITKPSASEWLVDDGTVELLGSNLEELIRCTRPSDKVFFSTQQVIRLDVTVTIPHALEFSRAPQPNIGSEESDASTTVFTCPTSGPALSVNTSSFTAVGISIANCKESASSGSIVVQPYSVATLKHIRIEDNKITGVYIDKHANVTIHDAYFAKNEVVGNGPAVHSKSNAYIRITNSTFKGNVAKQGYGGAIRIGSSNTVVMTGSVITGNKASLSGGGLSLDNGSTLTMFECEVSNNDATEGEGGGIFLGANNTAIINKAVLSYNFAKDGGAIYAVENNTLTMIDCVLSDNGVSGSGGGIELDSYNNLFMRRCVLSDNHGMWNGGAMVLLEYNNVTLQKCELLNNYAFNSGAMFVGGFNFLTIIDCLFSNNVASNEGGALRIYQYNNAFMRGCVFSYNDGGWYGGAMVLLRYNNVTLKNSELLYNYAEEGGAMIVGRSNSFTSVDCVFSYNFAESAGGGINLNSKNIAIVLKCRLLNNSATYGGALFAGEENKATIIDSTLAENRGEYNTKYGKGLYIKGTNNQVIVKNTTISRNFAHGAETSYPRSSMHAAIESVYKARIEEEDKYAQSVAY